MSEKVCGTVSVPKTDKTASVLIQDDQAPNTEEQVRAAQLLQSKYGRAAVNAYVQGWLGDADIRCSEELSLEEDKDYIMSLLAILGSKDTSAGYVVQELDGIFAKMAIRSRKCRSGGRRRSREF